MDKLVEEKRTQKILLHSAKQKSVNLNHTDITNQLLNKIFCCFNSLCSLKLQIPSTKKHENNGKISPFEDECIFLKNTGLFDCHPYQKKHCQQPFLHSQLSRQPVLSLSNPSRLSQVLVLCKFSWGDLKHLEKIQDFCVWFNSRLS